MRTYNNLYDKICSFENLYLAYKKARKRKSKKKYVIDFETNLNDSLLKLYYELKNQIYFPKPLKTFVIRDPKTRKISKSDFRDRIVHHALCNLIEPILSKSFIYDSYANRKKKGTHKAIQRFDIFKRKVSKNNHLLCYVLKIDIRHYFQEISHKVLLDMIKRKIRDENVVKLIEIILNNHKTNNVEKGMPLGNLTSQFFANVYLNELDNFMKRKLKAKYYIRYVDDIVILSNSKEELNNFLMQIELFLQTELNLEINKNKSKIKLIHSGIKMLGYRIFYYHKLLRKSNLWKFKRDFIKKLDLIKEGIMSTEEFIDSLNGWFGYAKWANIYTLRKKIVRSIYENRT